MLNRTLSHPMRLFAALFEAGFALLLIAEWIFDRPGSSEYYDGGQLLLIALVVSLFSGWYLLGGWRIALGCALQLLRIALLITLFVISIRAYNPHMDNPCHDTNGVDACIDRAQRHFKGVYLALAGVTLVSAAALAAYANTSEAGETD